MDSACDVAAQEGKSLLFSFLLLHSALDLFVVFAFAVRVLGVVIQWRAVLEPLVFKLF